MLLYIKVSWVKKGLMPYVPKFRNEVRAKLG